MIEQERRNNLIFLERFKDGKYFKYKCLCVDCNNETIIYSNNFGKAKNCGCTLKNPKRKVGDVRNGLRILEKIYTNTKVTQLQCLCLHCNNEAIIPYTMFGRQKSCGCFDHRKNQNHPNFKGYGEIHAGMWKQYYKNATRRGLPFKISLKQGWVLFLKQNRKCALSGIDLQMWPGSGYSERSQGTASLDRIDNKKGYTKNNVQWVHKDLNRMKSNFVQEDFTMWCHKVHDYMEEKNEDN